MLFENHSNFRFNVFEIQISELELLLTEWEHFHVVGYGVCDCKNIKCLGNYTLMRTAYSFRMKYEKHKKVTSLFGYDKIGLDENNLYTIVGMSARPIKKNDIVVLRNDFPNVSCNYKVISISYSLVQNGLIFFNSKLRFVGFNDNFLNN